jgi:hypothetical protein
MRARIAVLIAAALFLGYSGAYGRARASHLLVRQSPMCDPDRVVPGAGASPSLRVIFAPLIAVENTCWLVRSAWL